MKFLLTCGACGFELLAKEKSLLDHSKRVAQEVAKVLTEAPELTFDIDPLEVELATFLHDLGKSEWQKAYFTEKYYKLSKHDHNIMNCHPLVGGNLGGQIELPKAVVLLIEQHHERKGGTGYPQKIIDPQPVALLIGACDAFVACREPRAYRPEPLPISEALREVSKVGADKKVLEILIESA
ncbi:MAG: HD domain-containing protein [Desulfotomaculum sp.]|nr:HD domain-containing protein [Desulfotomaculum sp.]